MPDQNKNREDDAFQIFEDTFYEIEYDSCPMPGVGKYVLKSRKIEEPERDEVRERFNQMRNIARENRSYRFNSTRFYDKRVQEENSRIFYKQGMFMADFCDDYGNAASYSSYFPDYQTMGYEQLRTYFTWRTKVRQGNIDNISLSYAFLYLYELIGNIGVDSPEDGLEKIVEFWEVFRVYDQSIDKYVLKWLKDYYIYYELPWSFKEFAERNGLKNYYPNLDSTEDRFRLYASISKYDITKSSFYAENESLTEKCFQYVSDRLICFFKEGHMDFEDYVFQPVKNSSVWIPFQSALFYSVRTQRDRRVVLSEKEIYTCSGGKWTFSSTITTGSGKQLVGCCMKQMESTLRSLTGYRHKLTAGKSMMGDLTKEELERKGINLEKVVTDAVNEFYREATKTVVKVNVEALNKIRQEAYETQEKLTVPEEEVFSSARFSSDVKILSGECHNKSEYNQDEITDRSSSEHDQNEITDKSSSEHSQDEITDKSLSEHNRNEIADKSSSEHDRDESTDLWSALTQTEQEALLLAFSEDRDIRAFADEHGIMFEVLLDGINEKAVDVTGDGILDDEFTVYEDYYEQVKEMVSKYDQTGSY